jgi:hypothetical protein
MTEIKVILDEGPLSDLSTLNEEERELLFEQLAKDNPDIPKVIFDSFIDMQVESLDINAKLLKPDLKELLLRKVIQLGRNHGSDFNTIVVPIIPTFVAVNGRRPREVARGGAIPPMRRARPQEVVRKEALPGSIKVRFDQKIFAMTDDGIDYITPSNEEIEVIGIIINPICSPLQVVNGPDRMKPLTAVEVTPPEINGRIELGNYTYPDASAACDDYFIKPNYSIDIAGETFDSVTRVMFRDLDDKRVLTVLNTIFEYLAGFESHHTSIESAQFVHTQLDVALQGKSLALRPNLNSKIENIKRTREITSVRSKEPAKSDIVSILETLHYGRFSPVYLTALLADIDMRGFSRTYYKASIKGKDDPSVKEQLDVYKARQARNTFQNGIKVKLLDERNKLNAYKIIIEKKLGAKRLAQVEQEIARKPSITVAAKNILDLLSSAERKPVELEFTRREKYLESVLNNKCPHVKLYRQFRLAKTDDRSKKLYGDLKQFFKNPTETNNMITCNNCGFDIVCPHIREFTELDFAGKQYGEIKAKLTKYIDKAVVKDQYYCKICGEMISSLEAFGEISQTRDPASMMNEDLKNFMWGEIAILTKYLKFGTLINVPQLITAIRDACYPYIFEIEKQILKSKTNSAEEIKAKKRLFITIYAFAYMIHLILSNRGRGGAELSFKNFTPKNSKSAIVDMIKHVLEIIILSRNVIIREIPGITGDIIKNKLIEAYKSMQSAGAQVITYSGEAEDLLTTLMLDPVYKYLYTINILDDILSGRKPSKSKFDIVDRVDEIMGEPVAKLERANDIFARIKLPKLDNRWNLKAFDDLKPMVHGRAIINGKSIYAEAYRGYAARSFEVFSETLKKRLYNESMYIDVSVGGKGDPNAPMDVRFRPPHEKHHAEFLKLQEKEIMLMKYRQMEAAKNWTWLQGKNSRRWTRPPVTLGRLFDEDGNTHVWNIYIVEKTADGKLTRVEIKTADIAKSTEAGTKFTDTITDKKCSGCGVLWSQADTLDEAKIQESLDARHSISNFFRFYENRCPKGGLHDFGEGDKCSKCLIGSSYILNPTAKESLNYYREFRNVYTREREEFAIGEIALVSVPAKPVPDVSKYDTDYSKWTFNFNLILDLANKLKINHRLISAFGAVEKQEYAEVQSGVYIPPEAEYRYDTRVYVVDTHVKNLITEYNQVKFFHRLTKPPMDLSALIDNSGINKHKIADLNKKLPDIYNDYNGRFAYMQKYKKPREVVSFCIETFCEMCLKIWNDTDKETEKLRHDFVSYLVKKILRAEELLSKPGHFSWALLYGEKEVREKESYDSNTAQDLEGETDREYEDTEEHEEDFGDTSKPFDPGFDTEEAYDPDRDADDNDNEWKVGESLGLD